MSTPSRQQAAIMFTDIVGFTFLMGKDEKRGLDVLAANRAIHQACLAACHGELVKEIGDGMLSRFDSATDAVRCAVAIQKRVEEERQPYRLRVGIHQGEVMLQDGDVFGNTVNIANRVEALANPGAVFVTEPVVESMREIKGVQTIFLGEKSLKNVEPLMRIFGLAHEHLARPELRFFLEDSIDQDVQQYHLMEKLGVGGMGVIYRALDTRLQRTVALKFLSSQLNRDEKARARFLQEARAAAGLQHPHICTIYEIDETADGRFFIAMELIEGPTLQERLERDGPLPLPECLDLAIQIAEGLAHAHQAGVVHRDIKPGNIKVTPGGAAKILDFGLALTGDLKMFKLGARVGTVAYMSPEQARGDNVDTRTDIWSFGVTLYAMLSGRLPFSGDYDHAIIHAILSAAPAPLPAGLPPALTGLLGGCLEKEPAYRHQTARDLAAALRRLRRDLPGATPGVAPGHQPARPPARRWRLAAGLVAAVALGWLLAGVFRPGPRPDPATAPLELTAFTAMGELSLNPCWSPDGEWIVYGSDEAGSMDLWKKSPAGGQAVRLTAAPGNEVQPAWSADGRSIAYRGDTGGGGIFIIPADGGSAYRLTAFGSDPAWSPDSRHLVFGHGGNVYVASTAAGGEPRRLVEGTSADPHPIWSADGRRILFWHRTRGDVYVVDTAGGDLRALGLIPSGQEVGSLDLGPDGRRLLFSMGPFGGNKDLYEVLIDPGDSRPSAAPRHLTITTTDDIEGVYSPDGRRIALTARTVERHLYRIPIDTRSGRSAGPPQILTRHGKLNYYPALSADGAALVWTSHRSGQGNLYYRRLDGEDVTKVTPDWDAETREISGAFATDMRQVIYASTQGGSYQLWRVPAPGSVGLQLTETKHPLRDVHPCLSPDGGKVAFYSNRAGAWDIWQLDLNNGRKPAQLTDWPGNELYPAWSPDGRRLAFVADRDGNADIWTVAADGADARLLVSDPAEEAWCAWSPDQRWFFFVSDRGGSYNIWRVPAGGGPAEAVTAFRDLAFGLSENAIFTKFAVGAGQLILPLESRKGDIFLLNTGGEPEARE